MPTSSNTYQKTHHGFSLLQLDFYGNRAWKLVEHLTLPLCIFHRFHSAVALAEIWKNSYKPRIE